MTSADHPDAAAARFAIDSPGHHRWLDAESRRLLEFARASALADGGFGWLDARGAVTQGLPGRLYVTCRMTHVWALGVLLEIDGSEALVDHGLAALDGMFRDAEHGGWFGAVADGEPVDDTKTAYPHAFVVLAAASATIAGRPGAAGLLTEALAVQERRFWDDDAGMVVEAWDRTFSTLDTYRGMNSSMHTVEAYLAAAAATGDDRWLDRSLRITRRALANARDHAWRLPEHYDVHWRALLEHNSETPDDPFRPYGSTIGHWLEWSRLALHLRAALAARARSADAGPPAGPLTEPPADLLAELLDGARHLFDAAVAQGWSVDGEPGFVYTVDWDGNPRVRQRLHWVVCEALGAATALGSVTGEARYRELYATWWDYADRYLIDRVDGSWHHELDVTNRPAETIRPGKADVYHALQATLLPRLRLGPALASSLAELR
jgi:sulfoquinovose isomerase